MARAVTPPLSDTGDWAIETVSSRKVPEGADEPDPSSGQSAARQWHELFLSFPASKYSFGQLPLAMAELNRAGLNAFLHSSRAAMDAYERFGSHCMSAYCTALAAQLDLSRDLLAVRTKEQVKNLQSKWAGTFFTGVLDDMKALSATAIELATTVPGPFQEGMITLMRGTFAR